MNSTGTYLLTYTVQDGGGNTATATRTVTVVGARTVDLNATVAMDMIWCPPGPLRWVARSRRRGEMRIGKMSIMCLSRKAFTWASTGYTGSTRRL